MKKLILISVFAVVAACAKSETDSTTPPPPTVPVKKSPVPQPGKNAGNGPVAKPTPATPIVPVTPVTPVAPIAPVVPVKTTASAGMQSNVVWNCNNSVTGSTLQLNGYYNDLGEKLLLRIGKAEPVELSDVDSSNNRYCLKTSVDGDNSLYMLTGKWENVPKGFFHAVLTRFRNLPSSGTCNDSPRNSEYDIKEAFVCTLGERKNVNPDGDNAVPLKELFSFERRLSGGIEIKGIRRTLKGDGYLFIGTSINGANISPRVLHFDNKLNLDTQFGKSGELVLELPMEAGSDPIYKIYELLPDQDGGFLALVEMHSSRNVIVAHYDASGNLKKDILPNGFQMVEKNPDQIFQGAMGLIGKSILVGVSGKVMFIKNGVMNEISSSFTSLRRVMHISPTADGEILVSWKTQDYSHHWVTRLNLDGRVISSVEPAGDKALSYDSQLGVTIPLANGDFYYVDVDSSSRYSGIRIVKISKNNAVLGNYSYTAREQREYSMFSPIEARNFIIFANGTLAFPFRWQTNKHSYTIQAGALLIDPTGKATPGVPYTGYKSSIATTMNHTFTGDKGAVLWAGDDGKIYALGLYTEVHFSTSPKLILTKVSP